MSVKEVTLENGGALLTAGSMGSGGAMGSGGNVKEMYHHVLSFPNSKWEAIRERASQKAGNVPHPFHPYIREEREKHEGKRDMFDYIANLHAPRIAARILERHPNLTNESGGHFQRELHSLLTTDT